MPEAKAYALRRSDASRDRISISAKKLGEVALPDFCPRCFWIKLHVQYRPPFQVFPGIFSSIDSYTRKVVHQWFESHGEAPPWLSHIGRITGYRPPPHYSSFGIIDERLNIELRGSPDAIFVRPDRSHIIGDYKTAKYTATQDALFPMYETQLNAYALIGRQRGLAPVSGLALIYMEPVTDESAAAKRTNRRDEGFAMGFAAHVLRVEINLRSVCALLATVRDISDRRKPPAGREGCKECVRLDGLTTVVARAGRGT